MLFGDPADFAIEAYHEPSGPESAGCGRLCLHIQGAVLGNIRDNHCSLYSITDRFRELIGLPALPIPRGRHRLDSLWHELFTGTSDAEIYAFLEREIYVGEATHEIWDCTPFDFLTNSAEMFNNTTTFIVLRPGGRVHILYRLRDEYGSGSCEAQTFECVADAYIRWFDEQVQTTAPPYFPVDPFDLSKVGAESGES